MFKLPCFSSFSGQPACCVGWVFDYSWVVNFGLTQLLCCCVRLYLVFSFEIEIAVPSSLHNFRSDLDYLTDLVVFLVACTYQLLFLSFSTGIESVACSRPVLCVVVD